MSQKTAKSIGVLWKKSKIKLRLYGSKPVKVCGVYDEPIKFCDICTTTEIFIVKPNLETLISGHTAKTLGIISFHVNSISEGDSNEQIQAPASDDPTIEKYIAKFHKRFVGIGKADNNYLTSVREF